MFITLEGIEGSGKTTLIKSLHNFFTKNNKKITLTREPGGSLLGKKLRPIILSSSENLCMQAELFLFLADRAQHIEEVIRPALNRNEIVLCDRYVDSTIAYQGYGRGMDVNLLESLNTAATDSLSPQITFLLDLPAEIGVKRAVKRNELANLTESEGRFEAESILFHTNIRKGFLAQAEKHAHRFIILDATQDLESVASQAIKILISRNIHL